MTMLHSANYRHLRRRLPPRKLRTVFGKPWYHKLALPERRDLALLRPPRYDREGRNTGFETDDECAARDQANALVLDQGVKRGQRLAAKLDHCRAATPCGSTSCCRCMREFRRGYTGFALSPTRRLRNRGLKPYIVTIAWTDPVLREMPLREWQIQDLQQRLATVVQAAALDKVPMIGGIVINRQRKAWELRARLVVFVKDRSELDPPRWKKAKGVRKPIVIERVKRLHEALPGCWNFIPSGYVAGGAKTHQGQLRDPQLRQVLLWLDKHDPESLVYLQGFQRKSNRLHLSSSD